MAVLALARPELFAGLAIVVDLVSCAVYLASIFRKQSKPHVFSWGVWGLVIGIGATAQLRLDGGLSAWVLFAVSACCLLVAVLAVFIGEKHITISDWAALCGAMLAIVLWQVTNNPVIAVYCIIIVECLSYWPTIRKSWLKPREESSRYFFWGGLGYLFTWAAIPQMSFDNLLYPLFLMVTDWGFMAYLLVRRKQLEQEPA